LEENVPQLLDAVQKVFPSDSIDGDTYLRGLSVPKVDNSHKLDPTQRNKIDSLDVIAKNAFRYIIHTKVGEGPRELSAENSLLINGLPLEKEK